MAPYTQQTEHRAARDTPVDAFRMNRVLDYLSAIGGKGAAEDEQVFGGRPFRLHRKIHSAEDLVELAHSAMADFRSHRYQKQGFGWVDSMVLVEDEALLDKLRLQVARMVAARDDNVDVMLPDDLVGFDDDRAIEYIVPPHALSSRASDRVVTLKIIAGLVDGEDQRSLAKKLRFLDGAREEIATAPVLDCLAAQLEQAGERFLLCDGRFWRVDGDFLGRIDEALMKLDRCSIDLPAYGGGREDDWNQAALKTAPNKLVLLDKRFVYLEGETPFEPCDLISADGALIFVKRKGRSSTLNHLFAQVERSCRLLVQVPDAASQLRAHVIEAARVNDQSVSDQIVSALKVLDQRVPGLEVAIALLGDWRRRTLRQLPLLAKIGLFETIQRVEQMGYRPTIALIPLRSRTVGA